MCPVFRFLMGAHTPSPLHPAQKGRPAVLRNIEPRDCGDSQARWSRLLDMTEIPSTLQSPSVMMSLVHLALPALNYLSCIRYKKARLQSDRLIAI
jgi:hypothetical protein